MEGPTGPRYGRPSDRFGPPTALFSWELLKYDFEHLEAFVPDSVTADCAFDLIENAANFFEEIEREAALRPILRGILMGKCAAASPNRRRWTSQAIWGLIRGFLCLPDRRSEERSAGVWGRSVSTASTRINHFPRRIHLFVVCIRPINYLRPNIHPTQASSR